MLVKFNCRGGLALLAALLLTPAAHASLVDNGGFESGSFVPSFPATNPNVMQLPANSDEIDAWVTIGDGLAWGQNGNFANLTASEGTRFLDLTGFEDGGRFGVTQDITTQVNRIYELAFDLGSWDRFGVPVAVDASAGLVSNRLTSSNTDDADNGPLEWERVSMQFIALSDSTRISLIGATGNQFIGLDNVSVLEIGAIPVPAAVWLFGSALIGLAAYGRVRQSGWPKPPADPDRP